MSKFVYYSLKALVQAAIACEKFVSGLIKRNNLWVTRFLHPISISALVSTVAFFTTYEMFYIIPDMIYVNSLLYKLHWIGCLYLLHNILGNWIICWTTDTSIQSLPQDAQQPTLANAHLWHLCTRCQMMVPPRAWHCTLCDCCMLKRDHHCNVTGSCVGHRNQRYFVALLFNLALGSSVSFCYNVVHLFGKHVYISDPGSLLQNLFAVQSFDAEMLRSNFRFIIITGSILKFNLIMIGFAIGHLALQLFMICRGSCMYTFWDRSYDFGFWNNMRQVMGERMFWTWLSPFIDSPLPHNGTQWWHRSYDEDKKKPV